MTVHHHQRPMPDLPDDVVLSVRNVSKKFCRNLRRSMWYGMQDLGRNLLGLRPGREIRDSRLDISSPCPQSPISNPQSLISNNQSPITNNHASPIPNNQSLISNLQSLPANNQPPSSLRKDEFWALRDINFDLHKGECLGLVGDNGSGKTTLLRLITGIFPPDGGVVARRGRLGALISLGAGFHPHMTGRENVQLNGSILGMTRDEIESKFDSIVQFADIGEFIDAPVTTYSSGMHVRLGFSIAIHTDIDLLLVDEILAVGDIEFQEKCMYKMREILDSDRAVILVTHSMYRIESLSDRVLWLDHGTPKMIGECSEVVRRYRECDILRRQTKAKKAANGDLIESMFFTIHALEVLKMDGTTTSTLAYGEGFRVRIRFTAKRRIEKPLFNMQYFSRKSMVFETSMVADGGAPEFVSGPGIVECEIPSPALLPNKYEIALFIRTPEGAVDLVDMMTLAEFTILSEDLEKVPMDGPYALGHLMHGAFVYLPHKWEISRAAISQPR